MNLRNMTRRDLLREMGLGAALTLATAGSCIGLRAQTDRGRQNRFAAPGKEHPNVLFLFTDDQAFQTINALNNPAVKTPNMDRLVRRGTTFTHCFNQGGWHGAICVASRAMLNTGRYLWTCGGDTCGDWPLWGETLGKAGYDTFMTGKWHNQDAALRRSFKTVGPTGGGMFPSRDPDAAEHEKQGIVKDPYDRPRPGDSWSPYDTTLEGHWRKVDGRIIHSSKLWADTAIDYLNNHAAHSDNPFFMYVAFHAPHDPRQAPKEFVDMYPSAEIEVPPNFLPEHPFDQGDHKLRDELLAPFPRTKEAIQVHLSEYYAIISHADYHIGRILDALEQSGRADNTIVIFSADQGLAVGQHGLMGKQNQYDCSVRMPLVVCGPGIEPDRQIDALVYLQSMFATTCEMARVGIPETVQFPSLVPLLTGQKARLYDSVYGAYRDLQRMVRTERYKLIRYPHVTEVQLFDLEEDPWETKDLAEDPRYAGTVKKLDAELHRWMKLTGDTLELDTLQESMT
jgi:arylsulfatase A-like enzyme